MYTPITDVDSNLLAITNDELRGLSTVWNERREALESEGALKEFLTRMRREWAIETGIIERLYSWDRGVTELLISEGIEAAIIVSAGGLPRGQAEHVKDLIRDQEAIIEGLFGFVKGEFVLTEHYIRSLHQQFTLHQETTDAVDAHGNYVQVKLLRGEYKRLPNNPRRDDGSVHQYCPPELVVDEMEQLVRWYRQAEATTAPEVLAAWLHHRFAQIHPFQDGNGRVARALASLVLLRAGLFPLVIRESDRKDYIRALEAADEGNLLDLVRIFVRRQREAILMALGVERDVQKSKQADVILGAALKRLQGAAAASHEREKVVGIAEGLQVAAFERVDELAEKIASALHELEPKGEHWNARAFQSASHDNNLHWYSGQILDLAREEFGYQANLAMHRGWVKLGIRTDTQFEIVVSLHGFGPRFEGILVASAFSLRRVENDSGQRVSVGLAPLNEELFQFNYAEDIQQVRERFLPWLEECLALGLAEWNRTLPGS